MSDGREPCQELKADDPTFIVITDHRGKVRYIPSRSLSKYLTLERYYQNVVSVLEKGVPTPRLSITDLIIEKEFILNQLNRLAVPFEEIL